MFRSPRWARLKGAAAEEGDLDVLVEAMKGGEPAFFRNAIERGVPLHRLDGVRHRTHDQRVQSAPERALPSGDGREIGADESLAMTFRDLGIPSGEQLDLAARCRRRRRARCALRIRLRL